MSDLKMTADVENIKKMSTFPNRDDGMSAEQVKARFDQAAVDIKQHINEVIAPAIEKNQTVANNAVLFSEQTLKKDQQEQVRANIGAAKNTAVLYETQAISDEQKAVARANINAADASKAATSVDGHLPFAGNVALCAVSYVDQELSAQDKETARKNIDAVSLAKLAEVNAIAASKVSYTLQALSENQMAQARANIRALEIPTKSVARKVLRRELELSDFGTAEIEGVGIVGRQAALVPQLDFLNSVSGFDFDVEIQLNGENYRLSKADCTISAGETQYVQWLVSNPAISQYVFEIRQMSGVTVIEFMYNPTVFNLKLYEIAEELVDVPVVTAVNGIAADENGDVEVPLVSYEQQELTEDQKASARKNIGAAPAGYGWGETMAATMPDGDANNALTTGLYRAMITTANVPARCNLIFVQAAFGSIIYQTAYCDDGTLMRVRDHGLWSEWKPVGGSEKVYEHIATITVAPDADGSLPQHVIFTADSEGNAFQLSDFVIRAYAAFVSGNKSSLYMAVNNDAVISNGAIGSLATACRYFNIFFRQEADGCQRAEYTSSTPSDFYYNAQAPAEQSRLIPPMHNKPKSPFTKIDLYTLTPADGEKAWVEGSTFELWGVRV